MVRVGAKGTDPTRPRSCRAPLEFGGGSFPPGGTLELPLGEVRGGTTRPALN